MKMENNFLPSNSSIVEAFFRIYCSMNHVRVFFRHSNRFGALGVSLENSHNVLRARTGVLWIFFCFPWRCGWYDCSDTSVCVCARENSSAYLLHRIPLDSRNEMMKYELDVFAFELLLPICMARTHIVCVHIVCMCAKLLEFAKRTAKKCTQLSSDVLIYFMRIHFFPLCFCVQ